MSAIEALGWEHFKDRRVKRHGFGGAIRRLFPAHCSAFPHRFKGLDLFAFEGRIPRDRHERCRGLWSLKAGAAAQLRPSEAAQAA